MKITNLKTSLGELLYGPLLIKPKIYHDKRGLFYESWNKRNFDEFVGKEINFVQDNHSKSMKWVLRGLHYQKQPRAQGKLVRCIEGEIYDVIVDLRKNSQTFKQYAGIFLTSNSKEILWVPEGFAHGFLALKDNTEVQYKVNEYWNKELERSILWNDKTINISWPFGNGDVKPILNNKDANAKTFFDVEKLGDIF